MDMRDKTIKGLEECLSASCKGFKPGVYCPLPDEAWNYIRDALALLKEYERAIKFQSDRLDALLKAQELVEPTLRGGIGGYWYCGACNYQISRGDKFCRYCGHEVKWE